MGMYFHEEFLCVAGIGGYYANNQWYVTKTGTATVTHLAPQNAGDFGLYSLYPTNSFVSLGLNFNTMIMLGAPEGLEFATKVRLRASAFVDACCYAVGVGNANGASPYGAKNHKFIGIRYLNDSVDATAKNWYGVCRDGLTETTIDLGILATATASDNSQIFGFRRTSTGVEFVTYDLSDPAQAACTIVGEITTNIPTTALHPIITVESIAAHAQGYRGLNIDFFSLGGRCAR